MPLACCYLCQPVTMEAQIIVSVWSCTAAAPLPCCSCAHSLIKMLQNARVPLHGDKSSHTVSCADSARAEVHDAAVQQSTLAVDRYAKHLSSGAKLSCSMQRTPCYIWHAENSAQCQRAETQSTHVTEIVCQLMACQHVFFSAVVGRCWGKGHAVA